MRKMTLTCAILSGILLSFTTITASEIKTEDGKYNAPERRKEIINNLKEIKKYVPAIADQQFTMGQFVSPSIFDEKATVENKDSVLNNKTRILISIAVVSSVRCGDCASLFVAKAAKAGLSKKEILEAACVAVAFQGGPTMGFISTVILPAINEYGIK